MTDFEGLEALGLILPLAALLGVGLRRLGLPPLIAYLGTGLLLGPLTGIVSPSHSVDLLGEVGIALLLFVVGLELSAARLRNAGLLVLRAGVTQVLLTAGAAWLLGPLLGFTGSQQPIFALALTFSSTVVAVRLIADRRALDEPWGQVSVGVLLVQDLVVILSLTVLAGVVLDPTARAGAGLVIGIVRALGGTLLLIAALALAAKWLLPRLFTWGQRSLETLFIWSLAWCFLSILAAEQLGLSVELGAFVAGVTLAQLPHGPEIERRAAPLASVFLAVFFVTLGLRIDPTMALADPRALAAIVAFALIFKPLLLVLLLRPLGAEGAVMAALSLSQLSEFSLILAAVAGEAGLLVDDQVALLGMATLLSMAASALTFPLAHRWVALARRLGLIAEAGVAAVEREDGTASTTGARVLVVGMNPLGRALVERLHAHGAATVAIDTDGGKLAGLPGRIVIGDAAHPEVLHSAGLKGAALLVSALHIQEANLILASHAQGAGVPMSINAFSAEAAEELDELGCAHLMVSSSEGVRRFTEQMAATGLLTRGAG